MTPEQFARVYEVFGAAIEQPIADRRALVEQLCPDDEIVRGKVMHMLAEDNLTHPAIETAAIRAQLTSELPEPALPERVGPYEIIGKLGAGGMGIIYEARQESPNRRVALKVLRPGLLSRNMLRRFQQEAQLLGQLQHAGIAQIYEAGLADLPHGRQPFFAMEFIDGRPLDQHRQLASLTQAQCLELFARICDAVQHAHQRGIIHRDLKPANILVVPHTPDATNGTASGAVHDEIGQPKVLDFGIARTVDTDQAPLTLQTEVGQLIGTLAYMSPEQIDGDSRDLDTRCDVYALGVILYELLTGRRPHDLTGLSVPEAVRTVKDDEPAPLGTHSRTLRGDLETIVAKALEKDRERRYGSPAELAADVRRFLRSEPVTARPPSMLYLASRFTRRNRAVVAGTVIAFAALTIGLVAAVHFAIEARRNEIVSMEKESEARRVSYNALLAQAMAAYEDGAVETVKLALEAAPVEYRSWEHAYLSSRVSPVPSREYTPPPGSRYVNVGWSAEGPRAVAVSEDSIRVVDLQSATLLAELGADQLPARWLRFSQDGRRLIYDHCGTNVRDLVDGRAWRIDTWGGQVNEDASLIAYFDGTELVVLDLATNGDVLRRELPPHLVEGRDALAFSPGGGLLTVGDGARGLETFEVPSGAPRGRIDTSRLAWQDRGVQKATWLTDSVLSSYSIRQHQVTLHQHGHDPPFWRIEGLRLSPMSVTGSADGQWLLISQGRVTRLWSVAERKCMATLPGSQNGAFHPNGDQIALVRQWGGSVRVISLEQVVPPVVQHDKWVYHVCFSPDGSLLAVGGWSGNVQLWDTVTRRVVGTVTTKATITLGLSFSEDGQRLFVATRSGPAWGQRRPEWYHFGMAARGLEWVDVTTLVREDEPPAEPWRQHIRSGTATQLGRNGFSFYRHRDGKRIAPGPISPDDRYLAVTVPTNYEGNPLPARVGLYRVDPDDWFDATHWTAVIKDKLVREMTLPEDDPCYSLAFSADGKRLLGATQSGAVYVWEVATGDLVCKLEEHSDYVHQVVFSDDGTRLATASGDTTARLFDSVPPAEREAERITTAQRRAEMRATIQSWRLAGVDDEALAALLRSNDTLTSADRLVLFAASVGTP